MRLLLAAAMMGTSACLLVVDVSGLSGDPEPGDAASKASADVDAGAGDAASATGFCATHTSTFCDDFDTPPLGKRWSLVSGDPFLSLSTIEPRSAPNALRVVLNPAAPHLTKDLPAAQRVHVEADLRVDTATQKGDVDLIDLELTPAPTGLRRFTLALVWYLDSWVLEIDVNEDDPQYFQFRASFTEWRHLALDADFSAGSATISVDGQSMVTRTIPTSTSHGAQLRIGTPYAEGGTPWVVDFDNVRVDNR